MHPSGCAGAPLHWGPTADHARMHHALATCLSMRPALLPPRRSELWTHCTHPGTLRGLLRATVQWICGNGWTFTWPAHAGEAVADAPSIPAAAAAEGSLEGAVVVAIDAAGATYVDAQPVATEALATALREALAKSTRREVVVVADERATTGATVRAVDAAVLAGATVQIQARAPGAAR